MQKVPADDGILIERFQKGDQKAFNQLIERHRQRAYQYAFRLTRCEDEAADIVAEAFVRIYRALQNFKGQSAFTTWLYRIETNCFLDMRKRAKNRQALSIEDAVPTEDGELQLQVEDLSMGAYEHAEQGERLRAIEEAVQRLPEYQRAMIMMFHADMLSYDEIAAALDVPVGTVKSRLNRARVALRELLQPHQELFAQAS